MGFILLGIGGTLAVIAVGFAAGYILSAPAGLASGVIGECTKNLF